jgi:multidrug resistance efflux pump
VDAAVPPLGWSLAQAICYNPADSDKQGAWATMRPPPVKLSRSNVVLWIAAATSLLFAGVFVAAFDLWEQTNLYVSTDYAQVAGTLTEVVTPSVARVSGLYAELGGHVEAGQRLASIQPAGGSTIQDLVAPKGGVVVGLYAREGQVAFEGQPVAVLAEPSDLWVVANYPESALGAIRVGQPVEVQLVVIDRKLTGHVVEILPESSRPGASSGVAGTVPVRIAVDGDLSGLYPGMDAYVRIRVR